MTLWSSAAVAETFSDPKGDFEIDIPAAPGQKVCIVFPIERVKAQDCDKIDLSAFVFGAGPANTTLVGEAILMDDGKPLLFIVQRQDRAKTPKPEEYDQLLNELTGQSDGPRPLEHGRRMAQVGAMTVPQVDLSLPVGNSVFRAMVALIPVTEGAYVVAVVAPNRFPVTAGQAFERALRSVSVEAPRLDTAAPPPPKKASTGWILPVALGAGGGVIVVVALVVFLSRRSARKAREAAAAAEAARTAGVSMVGSGPLGSAWKKGSG